jgi:NitT/TauT family transport system substrate-binding protein
MCALPSLLCRLALCCLIVLCAGCGAAVDAPLRLGTNIWLGFEPFYVARKQNLLPPSVRLVEYASGAEVLGAFRNRSIDLAAVTLDEAISLAEHDPSLRVGLVLDYSNGADALVARPDIRQLADLKGRSVGVESFGVGAYLLGRALQRVGLSPRDVRMVPLPLDTHEAAFSRGQVDAVVTFYPVLARLREQGGQVLFDSRAMPGEIVDVLVFREDTARRHAPALVALGQAWFTAVKQIHLRDPVAMAAMVQRQKISPAALEQAMALLRLQDLKQNQLALGRANLALGPVMGNLGLSMRELGLVSRPLQPMNHLESCIVEGLAG